MERTKKINRKQIADYRKNNPPANSRNVKKLQEKKIKRGRFTNFR